MLFGLFIPRADCVFCIHRKALDWRRSDERVHQAGKRGSGGLMATRVSLRTIFLLAMVALVCLVAATYAVVVYTIRKNDILQDTNVKLLTAGHLTRVLAGPGYHDRIVDQTSVSKEQFDQIVARNDALCLSMGLQYVWSLMVVKDHIVFTTATHSVLTNSQSDCATFFEVHTNPDAYRHAFATMQPEFSTFHDKWGHGRMVLLPAWDRQGRKYLFAASMQLQSFDALLRRTMLESIGVSALLAALFSVVATVLVRRLTRPLQRLTAAVERMGQGELDGDLPHEGVRELAVLADAFDRMRATVRRQLAELREGEERFRMIFEQAAIGISVVALDGRFLRINQRYGDIVGYSREELLTKRFQDITHADDVEADEAQRQQMVAGQHPAYTAATRYLRKDGTVVWVRLHVALVRDAAGAPQLFISTIEDITERQRINAALAQSEADVSAILESTGDIIFSLEVQTRSLRRFNTAFAREIERSYGVQARPGLKAADIFPAALQPAWTALVERALAEGAYATEYFRPADQKYFELHFHPIQHARQVTALSVFIRDITDHKHAELALRANEEKLRAFLENSVIIGWLKDTEGRYVFLSDNYLRRFQIQREDRLGKTDADIWPGVVGEELRRNDQLVLESGQPLEIIEQVPNTDGTTSWWLCNKFVFTDAGGRRFVGGLGVDITERQRMEAALRASEVRHRELFNTMTEGLALHKVLFDEAGRPVDYIVLAVNPAFERLTGFQAHRLVGQRATMAYGVSAAPRLETYAQVALSRQAASFEDRFGQPPRLFRVTAYAPQAGYFATLLEDVTERQNMLDALRDSRAHLTAVLESTEDLIWSMDVQTLDILAFNTALAEDVWQTYGIRLRPGINLREVLPAERVTVFQHMLKQAVCEGRFTDVYYREKNPKYFERTFNPIVKEGQTISVSIFARDVTARKLAEQSLRESEEKFSRLAAYLESVLYSVDAVTREFRYVSPAFTRLLGYTLEDVRQMGGRRAFLGRVIQSGRFIHQDRHLDTLAQQTSGVGAHLEGWWRCKDGTLRYMQDHWMPVYVEGKLVSTEGILTDITQAKLAGNKLRENEAQLKNAQRLAKLGHWTWDVATDTVTWSEEIYELFRWDKLLPPPVAEHFKLFPPEQWPHVKSVLEHAAQTGEGYELETMIQRQDGTRGYMLAHGEALRDDQGRIRQLHGTVQDITERKKLEQQLLEVSEREQRRFGHDLHDGIGQQLAAMRFSTTTLMQRLAGHEKLDPHDVERLDRQLGETLKQVRHVARGLHPVSADPEGLMHGLRELCRQCQPLFGVHSTFACPEPVCVHDQQAAQNLYRIAQEAVRNAATHGAPQQITVQLQEAAGHIQLTISDDGKGLPREAKQKRGLGLDIMRYRASTIGATFELHNRPGAGVTIHCAWPVKT
jgi:PAS domain S-box-containing protein